MSKRLVLLLLVLVLLAGGCLLYIQISRSRITSNSNGQVVDNSDSKSNSKLPNWFAYDNYAKRVRVMLPKRPDKDSTEIEIAAGKTMPMDIRTAKSSDGSTYILNLAMVPLDVDTSKPQDVLDKLVADTTNNEEVSSLTSTNTTYSGKKAVDLAYVLSTPEGKFYVNKRIIILNKLLVIVSANSKSTKPVNYDDFVQSVELY